MFSPREFPGLSPRNFLILVFAAVLLSCLCPRQAAFAQSPDQWTRQTSRNVYPEPALPALPAAGGRITDLTFGTEIMRVTDERDGNLNGTFYPHWPTFNADSTRLLVKRYQTGDAVYDFNPETFTLGSSYTFPRLPDNGVVITESAIWSTTDPDTLYIMGWAGPKLWAFNARSRQYSLVHDFSRDAGFASGDYLWQMSMSADCNTFAFTHKNGSYETIGYTVYRRGTDSVLLNVVSRDEDEVRIDKTGRYLVLYRSTLDASGNECVIVDLETGGRNGLKPGAPDYAPGHGDLGTGIMVAWDNDNNQFLRRDLSNPHQTTTTLDMGRDWMNQHLSMLGGDESWALVSFFSYRGGGLEPGLFHDEVLLARTDGSGQVRRLLQHRSKAQDYWAMPRASMSYDGRFVAFSSNWGGANRTDLFVARINSTPAATPTPTPTPTP
nr:hypothetical protein [Acidobacteriota bacterium]